MSRSRGLSLNVEGLRQLQRELRSMERTLPRQLRKVNLEVAKTVTLKAKARAGGVKGGERLQRSIFAVAQQRNAAVEIRASAQRSLGALGYEFGGSQKQFPPWRGNDSNAGYAVYPTIRSESPFIPERYARGLDPLLRKVFPD